MLWSKIQRVLNPNCPYKIRQGARMDMSCSTYIALFNSQNLPREYISRQDKRSVKMTFTSFTQPDYLLGNNWHKKKWVDTKNKNITTNEMEVLFCTAEEVSEYNTD